MHYLTPGNNMDREELIHIYHLEKKLSEILPEIITAVNDPGLRSKLRGYLYQIKQNLQIMQDKVSGVPEKAKTGKKVLRSLPLTPWHKGSRINSFKKVSHVNVGGKSGTAILFAYKIGRTPAKNY